MSDKTELTNPPPQEATTRKITESDIKRIKLEPCPFCRKTPVVGPKDWRTEGNCVGYVHCVNPKCPAQPRVDENLKVCDERGSAGYKLVAINLWNSALI